MSHQASHATVVKPLLSQGQLDRILSARRSITSAEFQQQVAQHLGRPQSPGRKKVFVNGRSVWVCC
jgi:hypothetical protein